MAAPAPTQTFSVDVLPQPDQVFAVALNPAVDQIFLVSTLQVFETGRNIKVVRFEMPQAQSIPYEYPPGEEPGGIPSFTTDDITVVSFDMHDYTSQIYDPDAEGPPPCEVERPSAGLLYPRGDR